MASLALEVFILKATDIKFSTGDGLKDFLVIIGKQVEPF